MNVFDQLEQHYPAVIDRMPPTFDSHDFILELAHRQQMLYIQALAHFKSEPFRAAYGEIARRLHKFNHLIRHTGVRTSEDIFHQDNEAATWEKI